MGMGLHVYAKGVVVTPNGKAMVFHEAYQNLLYTSNRKVIDRILNSEDAYKEYINWAISLKENNNGPDIDIALKDFDDWINEKEENGFDIIWDMI